ncbi:MAG: CGNR zinc finger domain-containing protein, partial [Frankia sp.]
VGDQGVGDQGVGDRDGARPAAGRAGRPTWTSWFAGSSALAFARLMVDRQVKPGGLCAAVGCGTPFADLGRGDPRRYCSPRCATRERVAAHRRRQATDAH